MVQASASTAPTTMHFSARCSRSSTARASKPALAVARGRAALEPPGHRKSRQDRLLSLRAAPRAGSGSRGSGRRWRRAGGGEGEGEGRERAERGREGGAGEQEARSGRAGGRGSRRRVRRLQRLREGVNKKYLGVFLQTRSIIEFLLLCM